MYVYRCNEYAFDDNMFYGDLHVLVALPAEVCISFFKQIHRVLVFVPGSKAMLNCRVKKFEKLVVRK